MAKLDICFNEYYVYEDLTNYLKAVTQEYPQLASLESIGKSWEGRDIWALTLTNSETGTASDKPAVYADGNIHAGEVTASMVCLKIVDYLVNNYSKDEEVTHLLNTRTFYILPRVNPDGAEKYLTTPYMLRSSVRPYPEDGIDELPGLHPEDINDDGKILQMRVRDDYKGEWKQSPLDSRLMIPRRPSERKGPFYKVYTEGFIKDFDGEPFDFYSTPWGLDLNRNFPSNWNRDITTGGTYPTSEPETKAIIEFIIEHKNIGVLNAYHTTGGFYFRNPYTYTDEEMNPDDLRAIKEIANEGFLATGYADVKSNNRSTLTEWAYEHQGMISYTTELWDRYQRAGVSLEEYRTAETVAKQEEIGLKLLAWNDKELAGKGFFEWTKFDHPQLGTVEIGGWDPKFAAQNPPHHLLEQECHKNAMWCIRQAAALPECKIVDIATEKLKDNIFKVTALCENHGYLPSYITNKGKDIDVVKSDKVIIEGTGFKLLGGKDEIEVDFLDGYMNGQGRRPTPAKNCVKVNWIVETCQDSETEITIAFRSQRGGTSKQTVDLV